MKYLVIEIPDEVPTEKPGLVRRYTVEEQAERQLMQQVIDFAPTMIRFLAKLQARGAV